MGVPLLVFGRQGQMARELAGFTEAMFAGRETLDLAVADPAHLIRDLRPQAVINASGYTAVDAAEHDEAAAMRLNRDVPREMARACAERDIPFVHFSTDYVFDGRKGNPYSEDDRPAPLNVYGRSKAEGEDAVMLAGGRSAVLRTSWVYSRYGRNFVRSMLRLAEDRDVVQVVDDQLGRPTWAREAAEAALRILAPLRAGAAGGLYHVAGAGDANWAVFATALFRESERRGGPSAVVERVSSSAFGAPAARPSDSRLDDSRLRRLLGWGPAPWPEGLSACLDELLGPRR